MKLPNAAKGISKIFTAEILSIIGVIVIGISSIVIILSAGNIDYKTALESPTGGVLIGLVIAIIAGITVLASAILSIVGIFQAGKDERSFKIALYLMIADVVLTIVIGIIANAMGIKDLGSSISSVIELFVTIYVIKGIVGLANTLNNPEIANKGTSYIKSLVAVFIAEIITRFTSTFTQNQIAQNISLTLTIIIVIISLAKYFIYLSLLSKTKKMLAE